MDFPKVDEKRVISETAERIFLDCMTPSHWGVTKIPQESDYGLDFRVERRKQGQNTGQDFFVQLKGFSTIEDQGSIKIRIKTTTLNYWKNKLIPILLVAVDCSNRITYSDWFDPGMDIDRNQQSVTLSIPRENEFNTDKITDYIDHYFSGFVSIIQDQEYLRAASGLFEKSLLMADATAKFFIHLTLVVPTISDKSEWEADIQQTTMRLAVLFTTFAREIPAVVAKLDKGGFSGRLSSLLTALNDLFRDLFYPVGDVGTTSMFLYKKEKTLNSLPQLIATFNELNIELAKHLSIKVGT